MPFNEGQLKAIMQRQSSILVSAPAGSGKTKILVSRIVELLKEGYSINDFLVVTFTEAAGNEMKQRLLEELNELVSTDIDHQLKIHLQQQITHLPNAYITNFHGFCNLLLMKYGYLIGIMPGFSINSDPSSLKKEVLHECLEEWVIDEQYQEFLSLYFPGYSFEQFENTLLSIDEISHSIDDFYAYVDSIFNQCYDSLSDSLEEWTIFPHIQTILYNEVILAMNKLIELKYYCETYQITAFYDRPEEQNDKNAQLPIPFETYYDYLEERIKAFSHQITYDTFLSLVNSPLPKSYTMSWKDIDLQIKETFNKMKTDVLQSYKNAVKNYVPQDLQDFIDKMQISQHALELLLKKGQLLDQFQQRYQLKKRKLNQLDFSDLEKYAHQLLEPEYGIVQKLYHSLKELMVDEYQDTNQIQESLLLKIAHYQKPYIPLFMVGDMKQSIYRFRQADPQIFSNKYLQFSLTDEDCLKTQTRRIDLIYNYRSSKVVLDSINFIFNQIMDKEIGGLEYYFDESARLNYDYIGKENNQREQARQRIFKDTDLKTEILIDIYNPQSPLDKDQYEAHMVAQKIIQLKKEMMIDNHPIHYHDIVVLMRSTPSFLTFKKVFDQYNIPNHIVLSQGLMTSHEVISMMSFLKAIINPYDDIALLSVLRQPYTITMFDMNEIAQLRMNHKDIPLYENIKLSTNPKILSFLDTFEQIRQYSLSHSPYELILKIDEITQYRLFVSQLVNGLQRKSNLDLFYEIIKQKQETTPYLTDLIEELENGSDVAPATSTSDNAVEFMTIHKSKGLEFPIVFVCQTHKKFNTQDSKERLIIDKALGFSIKPRVRKENDLFVEYDNIYRQIIARHQLNESINEEMRILYVALTRASHKLILTGMIKDIDEVAQIQQRLLVNESPDIYRKKQGDHTLLYERLRKTNNYLTWVLSAVLRHPDVIHQCLHIEALKENAKKLESCSFDFLITRDSTEHAMFSLNFTEDQNIEKNIPKKNNKINTIDTQLQTKYDDFIYPYDTKKTRTIAVTQLQQLHDDHYLNIAQEETQDIMTATDKGTLVHLLLSTLSFQNDNLQECINDLYQQNLCDEQGLNVLNNYQKQLQGFIDSQYYTMISQASHIYKEKAFTYYDQDLKQIVHGIFDLVFIYQNQLYVLDYKTDRISLKNSNENLIQKHQIQLNYYQKVLKEMYHQDVHAIVYYLHISKGVEF